MGVRVGVAIFFFDALWALEWAWQIFCVMGVRVGVANFFLWALEWAWQIFFWITEWAWQTFFGSIDRFSTKSFQFI